MRSLATLILILAVTLTSTVAYPSSQAQGQSTAATPPNILFVLTDDMREDDLQYMPKTRSLLQDQGETFSNAYVSFPLCCPSRSSILTGKYGHNTGIKSNRGGFKKFKDKGHEAHTVATALDAQGYRTGLYGKYLNGYTNASHIPPGWDQWGAIIDNDKGGSEYYNFSLSENGRKVNYDRGEYQTDVLSDKADAFVRSSDQPFFLYLTPSAPHNPAVPAPLYKGTLSSEVPDKHQEKRAETLLSVDDMVERLTNTLSEKGELSNTYLVFFSDNGWMQGEHGIESGKATFFEEAVSMPLLIRGPNIPAATTTKGLAANTDLAPTFSELGGTSLQGADGRSLVPLFGGTTPDTWRKSFLLENLSDKRGPYHAIVSEKYKYVEEGNAGDKLYDLQNDPHESTNLMGDPGYGSVVDGLRANLASLKDCSGQSCRDAEDDP